MKQAKKEDDKTRKLKIMIALAGGILILLIIFVVILRFAFS